MVTSTTSEGFAPERLVNCMDIYGEEGWELVTVVVGEGELHAFLKRPLDEGRPEYDFVKGDGFELPERVEELLSQGWEVVGASSANGSDGDIVHFAHVVRGQRGKEESDNER